MARIRSSISFCICGVQLLVSPKISTLDGTALCAPSVKSSVQEITAASKGEAFLETTVCNARMIWEAVTSGRCHMGAGSVEAFSFDLNAEVVLACHNAAGFSMQFSFWRMVRYGCHKSHPLGISLKVRHRSWPWSLFLVLLQAGRYSVQFH